MLIFPRDIRLAIRALLKNPAMTAVALLSLALGIGANTAIFSLLNAVVLRPLPVPHPEQIVHLATNIADDLNHDQPFSRPMFQELSRQQKLFADIFCWNGGSVSNFEIGGVRFASTLATVSGTYYRAMERRPLLGRYITPEDIANESGTSNSVAVISYRVWRHWFHSSSQVLGQTIRVGDNHPFLVIGVEPEGFSDISPDGYSEITVPIYSPGTMEDRSRELLRFDIFARLKPNSSLAQSRAGLQALWPHILEATVPPGHSGERLTRFFARKIKVESAATGVSSLRKRFAYSLQILMAFVGSLLFIACLNLANLSLAKAAAQRHQSGVQAALGASTWDLLRPALIESLLLSLVGALLGLFLALWPSRMILKMAWSGFFDTAIDLSPDLNVLAFTAAIATLTGVLFGIVPALYAARIDPIEALKQQSRSVKGGANLFGKGLLVVQIALSLMLTLGALLFGRTLTSLHNVDAGYRRDHLLTFVLFPQAGGLKPGDASAYYRDLAAKVRSIPGVDSVSYSNGAPAIEYEYLSHVAGPSESSPAQAIQETIAPDFFTTAGMHLVAGRDFRWAEEAPESVIISQSLAENLFGEQSAIGRTIYQGPHSFRSPLTVIGVVNSASLWKVESIQPMAYYLPFRMPTYNDDPIMVVRTMIEPALLKTPAEKVIRDMGHHYSLKTETVDERLDSHIAIQRLTAWLSQFFALVALLIASVGLYGLMSFHVTRRTNELGIRSALGADRRQLLLMILREALLLAASGCLLGLLVGLSTSRYLRSILFGVKPDDPASIAIAVMTMLAVATAAAFIPATRAAEVDPLTALRAD